jgi:iron complex transport system permease protein
VDKKTIIILSFFIIIGMSFFLFFQNLDGSLLILRGPALLSAFGSCLILALCGLVLQTLFYNPLAGPYTLGINQGAYFTLVLSFLLPQMATGAFPFFFFSLIGAAFILGLLKIVQKMFCSSSILLIVGLILNYFFSALIQMFQNFLSAEELQKVFIWSGGTFFYNSLYEGLILLLFGIFFLFFLFYKKNILDLLLLGETKAFSFGVNVVRERQLFLALVATGVCLVITFCGPLMFLGTVTPHLARLTLKGQKHGPLMILTALYAFLIGVATLNMMNFSSLSMPMNALFGLFGAPFILLLFFRGSRFMR